MLGEFLLQQEAFTGIPTMPRHSHSWSSLLIVVLFFLRQRNWYALLMRDSAGWQ